MSELTKREKELVSIGAAIGSNCVPCIEYHIPEAKKAGLTDLQIREAIKIADLVKKVPTEKILSVALELISAKEKNVLEIEKPCDCLQNNGEANKSKCC